MMCTINITSTCETTPLMVFWINQILYRRFTLFYKKNVFLHMYKRKNRKSAFEKQSKDWQTVDYHRLQWVKSATKHNKVCNTVFKHSHPSSSVGIPTDKGVCECRKMQKPWRVLFIGSHYISMHEIEQIKSGHRIKRRTWILPQTKFTNMLIHVCFCDSISQTDKTWRQMS